MEAYQKMQFSKLDSVVDSEIDSDLNHMIFLVWKTIFLYDSISFVYVFILEMTPNLSDIPEKVEK